jgi:hypothetical protein
MSASSLVPRNGAVAIGSMVADFASFDIEASQSVENVTPYGSNACAKNVGNGTPDFTMHVGAFALAHASDTAPGLPALSATGQTCTFTLDTGVTESGPCVVQDIKISHARMKAAVPIAFTLKCAGDITETWATG